MMHYIYAHACFTQDCPEAAIRNLTCTPGLFGGVDEGKHVDLNCSSGAEDPFRRDHHSLLCVQQGHPNYLGLYYDEVVLLETTSSLAGAATTLPLGLVKLPTFLQKAASSSLPRPTSASLGSYRVNGVRLVEERRMKQHNVQGGLRDDSGGYYRFGESVETVYDSSTGLSGLLYLPQPVMTGGTCVPSPVAFLRDSPPAACPRWLAEDECDALDLRSVLSSASVRLNRTDADGVFIQTRLFYTDAASEYVSGHKRDLARIMKVDAADDLLSHIKVGTRKCQGWCKFTHKLEELPDRYSAVDVGNDSSLPQARLDRRTRTCANVLLELHYTLTWSGGGSLAGVRADILLGDVIVGRERGKVAILNQIFSASFIHKNNRRDHNGNTRRRSGQPGYDIGGALVTSGSFHTWSLPASQSQDSSLCRDASVRKVSFGDDVVASGCFVELGRDNFTDCRQLRRSLEEVFDALFASAEVYKGGNHSRNDNDSVPVLKSEAYNNGTSSSLVLSCVVPVAVAAKITFSRALIAAERPVQRLNGVLLERQYERWEWRCQKGGLGEREQQCPDIRRFELRATARFQEIPLIWHHQNTTE